MRITIAPIEWHRAEDKLSLRLLSSIAYIIEEELAFCYSPILIIRPLVRKLVITVDINHVHINSNFHGSYTKYPRIILFTADSD